MRSEDRTGELGECFLTEIAMEGYLPLGEGEKGALIHLPDSEKSITKRKLRGDRNCCPSCSQYFNSITAFDQHRIGSFKAGRRCLSISDMESQNFGKTKDGFWLCPVLAEDRKRLALLRTGMKTGGR
jgi:hypothetical protein